MHRVKIEEVKRQIAKQIGKNNDLRERQQQNSLDSFKYLSWLNQQFYSPLFCNMPKKAMDEFEKLFHKQTKRSV